MQTRAQIYEANDAYILTKARAFGKTDGDKGLNSALANINSYIETTFSDDCDSPNTFTIGWGEIRIGNTGDYECECEHEHLECDRVEIETDPFAISDEDVDTIVAYKGDKIKIKGFVHSVPNGYLTLRELLKKILFSERYVINENLEAHRELSMTGFWYTKLDGEDTDYSVQWI